MLKQLVVKEISHRNTPYWTEKEEEEKEEKEEEEERRTRVIVV